jgi:transcriptional antiterminator RfaH
MGGASWYAVQTKPRREEQVRSRLEGQHGVEVFLPKLEVLRKRRSRRRSVIEPLFPSYLFVQMALDPDPWYAVKWAPGVRRIVCTGETPTPVPEEAVAFLRGRCGAGEVIQWKPALRAGATVYVTEGPFAGLQGILDRPAAGGERVRVLLSLMGCLTPVEMDLVDIELVA